MFCNIYKEQNLKEKKKRFAYSYYFILRFGCIDTTKHTLYGCLF